MNIDRINKEVFTKLGQEKQLVEYHDIIYKLLGIVVDFINSDGESLKLSKMKHFNPFCSMIRSTKDGFAACQKCDRINANTASIKHKEVVYKCHTGLLEIVVPLYDSKDNYIGCMTSGQFFLEGETPVPKKALEKTARLYNLNPTTLYNAYKESKIISKIQLDGIIDYLKTVGRIIADTHNKILFWETVDAPDKISLIKQFVKDNYMKKLTMPDVAKKFFLSSGHFSRFCTKELGLSFMSFVNMYRISQAEEMLKNTRRSISEIAFLTGFGSISQFNRTFKNIKGLPAKEFRKSDH